MRTVKSILTCVLPISYSRLVVECQISWLFKTKKSVQMVKLELCDFKLKMKMDLWISLDSAHVAFFNLRDITIKVMVIEGGEP